MKARIDVQKAAETEVFGALVVGADRKHRNGGAAGRFTPAQNRALSHLVRSLVQIARQAGAGRGRVTLGKVSLELQEKGNEEVLSVRTAAE